MAVVSIHISFLWSSSLLHTAVDTFWKRSLSRCLDRVAVFIFRNNDQCCMLFAAQGRVDSIVSNIFDIRSEYLGFITSNLAKVSTPSTVVNDIFSRHPFYLHGFTSAVSAVDSLS